MKVLVLVIILANIAFVETNQEPKPESEIKFRWGIEYNYIGQMHHSLNRYEVMIAMEIPNFQDLPKYEPLDTSVNYCDQWMPDIKDQIIHHTCSQIWPAYVTTVKLKH